MTQDIVKPDIPVDLREIDEDCLVYDKEFGWLPRFNGLMKLANKYGVLLFTKSEICPTKDGIVAIARCELIPNMAYFAARMNLQPTSTPDGKSYDWSNIEEAYKTFMYNKEKFIGEDVGEANALNLGSDFLAYSAATATTRAQARALKKLLNIKYMIAEEVKFEKAMQTIELTKKGVEKSAPTQKRVDEPEKEDKDSKAHVISQISTLMKGDKGAIAIAQTATNKAGKALEDLPIYELQILLNRIHEHKKKIAE